MLPHQERLVAERDGLADKLTKLNEFLGGDVFNDLSEEERLQLARQSGVMKDYLDILNNRIAAISGNK